ncbi:DNA alkylation repair protein [Oceanobacillus luteolus]|uniref:DNA alkylation repair protein n=1 Tax=Oceanobacillus luteolus TaxID=1274358 RepID=A0ABW4HRP5_9BACI|nr:DNA alkylation repair protein [Oceanobacillus luteolus]MCM3738923.1 DNA alkylation repair protein [Oceanobacillus luteolus]
MDYIEYIQQLFNEHEDKENAFHMEKYMRNKFPFLGIKTPLRRKLMQQFLKESGIRKEKFQRTFVRSLWNLKEREYQYAALDYIGVSLEKLDKSDISLMEELITSKSWWDTVDMLAQKAVGKISRSFPGVIEENIEFWNDSDHLWLQRSAILFQLKYKEQTNEDLLYRYIITHSQSKEFFIQKAIGWALREYSKTNPDSVRQFMEKHPLSKLSVREGSKYI